MKQALKHKKNRSEDSYNTQKGTTLIELVVVIFIIILITGIVLANYNMGGKQLALERAVHRFTQAVRQAQQTAMAPGENYCPAYPDYKGGYGIYIHRNYDEYSYFVFADCDNNEDYDRGDPPAADYLVYSAKFGEGVEFDFSRPSPPAMGPNTTNARIIFYPPTPVATLSPGDDQSVDIRFKINGYGRFFVINQPGLIYSYAD